MHTKHYIPLTGMYLLALVSLTVIRTPKLCDRYMSHANLWVAFLNSQVNHSQSVLQTLNFTVRPHSGHTNDSLLTSWYCLYDNSYVNVCKEWTNDLTTHNTDHDKDIAQHTIQRIPLTGIYICYHLCHWLSYEHQMCTIVTWHEASKMSLSRNPWLYLKSIKVTHSALPAIKFAAAVRLQTERLTTW